MPDLTTSAGRDELLRKIGWCNQLGIESIDEVPVGDLLALLDQADAGESMRRLLGKALAILDDCHDRGHLNGIQLKIRNEIVLAVMGAPPPARAAAVCRACGKSLLPENYWIADGCLCNSERGINHGLVPTAVCACKVCDQAQTGASRFRAAAEETK
jgi:hypothetical protein